MAQQCSLRCLLDSHPPIKLPHNQEIIVGRCKTTKIKDQACSRQQLSFKADCEQCFVEVKQLGINPSGVDGFALTKTGSYKLNHGSRVELLLNNYIHVIQFEPQSDTAEKPTSKRKLEEDEDAKLLSDSAQKPKRIKEEKDTTMAVQKIKSSLMKMVHHDHWESIGKGELYVYTPKGTKSSCKIAGFDMDGTLIKTKSGKIFPVDIHDWQLLFPNVSQKLKDLFEDGFKIVIMSNQAPIGNGRVKIEDFKKKIESLVKEIDVPIQVYLATGKGLYRKPAIGMWKVLTEEKNDGLTIDMESSFYCGDAAGRLANWAPGKKKDHSLADKLLAENIGLKFYTPEQFFLGHSLTNIPMAKPEFEPKDVQPEPFDDNLISDEQEILVLVGYPGSGKSFLANLIGKKSCNKYTAVCRDVLGSWQKCAAKATELIKKGKSVIVDSTNPDPESRGRWTSLAKELHVKCRCAKLATTKPHARHNNKFRELMKINHVPVNDIVFNTYKNKYSEPNVSEGFNEVIEVKFNPCFEDEEAEKLYKMHLLEK